MLPNKLREQIVLKHSGYISKFEAPGFVGESGFTVESYLGKAKRYLGSMSFYSSVIIDDDDDSRVLAEIKSGMANALVHYFYKDIVDSLYTALHHLGKGQNKEASDTILEVLNSINGRDNNGK